MTDYKLTYFDVDGGRAEPIRIAFHAAGIDFEDMRISFPEFGEMREAFRFNAVPVLDIDGSIVTQSNALCRYVGKSAGLYPEDDLQALYCDEAMDAAEDITHHVARTLDLEGDALKNAREELADGWLTVYLGGLDALLARGGGTYFADDRLTIADLKVFYVTRWLSSGMLDHIPADIVERLAPGLAKHQELVAVDPLVTTYYASRS